MIMFLLCLLTVQHGGAARQLLQTEPAPVSLEVQLRDETGAPVTDHPIRLLRFAAVKRSAESCRTDADGVCRWRVPSGVYEIDLGQPLDPLSTLASAESGFRHFGITVGSEPIRYGFVFHSDGNAYFDQAPEAAIPQPIIPQPNDIHQHGSEAVVPPPEQPPAVMPTPTEPSVSAESASSQSITHILLYALGGLLVGAIIWGARRPRQMVRGATDA